MCKHNPKSGNKRIDPCMRKAIELLNLYGIKTKECCCGHGKYPMTIICSGKYMPESFELFIGTVIPRKKRFYRRDKDGYYYIPETLKVKHG